MLVRGVWADEWAKMWKWRRIMGGVGRNNFTNGERACRRRDVRADKPAVEIRILGLGAGSGRVRADKPAVGVGCSGWVREMGRCLPTSPRWGFEGSGWAREVGRCEATEGGDQRTSTRVAATAPTGPWTPRVRKATSVRRRRLKRVVVAKRADKPRPTGSFISPCTR